MDTVEATGIPVVLAALKQAQDALLPLADAFGRRRHEGFYLKGKSMQVCARLRGILCFCLPECARVFFVCV